MGANRHLFIVSECDEHYLGAKKPNDEVMFLATGYVLSHDTETKLRIRNYTQHRTPAMKCAH